MPGIPQTLEVPPPVSVQTLIWAIRQSVVDGGGGGGGSVAFSAITGNATDNPSLVSTFVQKAGDTMTGALVNSTNGAASTPPLKLTGAIFTGGSATTTKPQFLIEPAGTTSNNWSTAGTGLGINAASGFAGNLMDLQVNAASRVQILADGSHYCSGYYGFSGGTALPFQGMSLMSGGTSPVCISGVGTGIITFGMAGGTMGYVQMRADTTFGWSADNTINQSNSNDTSLTRQSAGVVEITSAIRTGAPNTGTAANWKLGSVITSAITVDLTRYVEIDIGGTLVKLVSAA